jgi:HK97 gp10 family phage protein
MAFKIAIQFQVNAGILQGVVSRVPGMETFIVSTAADFVESHAKAIVPVDTGALKGSIKAAVIGSNAVVEASMPYAGYVEWGTRKMAAQPYLRPAFEALRWNNILKQAFRNIGL